MTYARYQRGASRDFESAEPRSYPYDRNRGPCYEPEDRMAVFFWALPAGADLRAGRWYAGRYNATEGAFEVEGRDGSWRPVPGAAYWRPQDAVNHPEATRTDVVAFEEQVEWRIRKRFGKFAHQARYVLVAHLAARGSSPIWIPAGWVRKKHRTWVENRLAKLRGDR